MNTLTQSPDLILHNGRFTTLNRANPIASAVAIKDGKFLAVGGNADIMSLAGTATKVIDLKGRPVLPGLIDNHTHVVRGGLNFNMELRWDGVRSLADAMNMLKRQVAVTPPPQWVRVVGGFGAWKDSKGEGEGSWQQMAALSCGCSTGCAVHGHDHARAWSGNAPASDLRSFWGALGCACWAV